MRFGTFLGHRASAAPPWANEFPLCGRRRGVDVHHPHAGRRHARDRRGTGRRQAPADAFDGCRWAFHSTSGFGRRVDEDRRPPGFGAIRAALQRPVSSAFGLRAREFDLQVPRVLRSPGDWTSHVVPPPGILHWTHVAVPLAEVAHGWVHPADGRLRRSRRGRRHVGRMEDSDRGVTFVQRCPKLAFLCGSRSGSARPVRAEATDHVRV